MPWRNAPRLLRAAARLELRPAVRRPRHLGHRSDRSAWRPSNGWDWARFAGYVADADLPALYAAARVFAYPSLYEGFGIPPLEAMACGTPVVASTAGALPEVLGDAALLVDPYDEDALAEALQAAADDRGELRRRGLERAARYTWQRAAAADLAGLRRPCTPRMKALFFLLDGETNASSHQRVLQYFPYLRAARHRAAGQPARARAALPAPRRTRRRGAGAQSRPSTACFWRSRALDVAARQTGPTSSSSSATCFRSARRGSNACSRAATAPGLRHRRRHVPAARPSRPTRRSSACAASTRSPTSSPRALGQRRHRADRRLGAPLQPERLRRADGRRPGRVRPRRALRPARDTAAIVLGWAGTAGGLRYLDAAGARAARPGAQRTTIVVRVISGGYRRVCLPGRARRRPPLASRDSASPT